MQAGSMLCRMPDEESATWNRVEPPLLHQHQAGGMCGVWGGSLGKPPPQKGDATRSLRCRAASCALRKTKPVRFGFRISDGTNYVFTA